MIWSIFLWLGNKLCSSKNKNYTNHQRFTTCSMMMCIGGTGAEKTNALLTYLARSSG
jgi:hypothetical protein